MASKNLELYLVGKDLSASKAVKGLGTQLDKTAASGSRMGTALKTGLAVGAGAAVALGVSAVHMAMQFQDAQVRLESAVKNVGGSFDQLKPKVDDLDGKMAKLGFTGTEVESSLAGLVTATKDPTKAISLMGLAADIARGRNIDLATATNILVKVETGHVALLGRLGIATKDATGKTISQDEAVRRLTDLYGGDAQASADTFAGKMRTLKAESEDLAVKLGSALIPAVSAVVTALLATVGAAEGTVHWFEQNKAAAFALGTLIGVLLVPTLVDLAASAYRFVAVNIAEAFFLAADAAKALAVGEALADAALGPFAIAAAAAAFLVVRSNEASKKSWDEGKKAADDYADSLSKNVDSVDTMQQSLGRLQDKLAAQRAVVEGAIAAGNGLNGSFFKQISTLGELDDRTKQQATAVAQMSDNQSALAHQYGLTTAQVEVLAAVNNIDLTGSLDGVSQAFRKAFTATQATHKPMTQAAIDFKKVGDKSLTASEQVKALKEAFDLLAGKSLSADEASITFANDLVDLKAKLTAAKGSMDLTTQAGRDARDSFDQTAQAALDLATAQKDAGYSTDTIKKSLDKSIASLEKAGGSNAYVKTEVDKLKAAESGLKGAVDATNASLRNVPSNPYSGVKIPHTSGTAGTGKFYADGGWVDAPLGQPQVAVVHGGEFVLSRKMLAGAGKASASPMTTARGGDIHVHVYNAAVGTPGEIAKGLVREINRELKRLSAKGYATNN